MLLRRLLLTCLVLSISLLYLPSALALSYWGKQSLERLQTDIPKVEEMLDESIFDGKTLKADMAAAKTYYNKISGDIGRLIELVKKMSAQDRGDPGVRKVVAKVIKLQDYRKALNAAIYGDPKMVAADEKLCPEFFNTVILPSLEQAGVSKPRATSGDALYVLLRLAQEHHPETRGNERPANYENRVYIRTEHIERDLKIIKLAAPHCAKAKFKEVGKYCSTYKMRFRNPWQNPLIWCAAARNYKSLFKKAFQKHLANTVEHITKHVMDKERLQRREGWISKEGAVTFKELTTFPQARKDKLIAEQKSFYAAAGLPFPEDTSSMFKKVDDKYAAFAQAILDLAPNWELPKKKGSFGAISKAKKVVKSWHSRASIKKAFMVQTSWQLSKGVKDSKGSIHAKPHRSRAGYLLYKLPDEKVCQLRSFDLRQYWAGSWQKTEARMKTMRFQACK